MEDTENLRIKKISHSYLASMIQSFMNRKFTVNPIFTSLFLCAASIFPINVFHYQTSRTTVYTNNAFPKARSMLPYKMTNHMLYLKWNTSRHPKLNVNIAIRLLHCICYHMVSDRTLTEEMLFRLKRQTIVLVKNPTYLFLAFKHHFYFVWNP